MSDLSYLKKTPLYDEHLKLKAKIVDFGGWAMPVQYEGILAEHIQCREKVALFDTCHMGEFFFKGDIKKSGIETPLSFSIDKISIGKCKYGFLLNENGGIVDDLIVYKITPDEFMMVVNASTSDNDFSILKSYLKNDTKFENHSHKMAKIDVQGPLSRDLLIKLFGKQINDIKYFNFIKMNLLDEDCIISRTGYTGELGYEFYLPAKNASTLWRKLLENDTVKSAGLGARDVLRLEMGYSLYGNDLAENITPFEADLGIFVDFNKEFLGQNILKQQKEKGVKQIKVAFKTNSRRAPRSHYKIIVDEKEVGEVTSGIFSPMLGFGIGLGLIKPEMNKIGKKIILNQGKVNIEAEITELPFYKNSSLRK